MQTNVWMISFQTENWLMTEQDNSSLSGSRVTLRWTAGDTGFIRRVIHSIKRQTDRQTTIWQGLGRECSLSTWERQHGGALKRRYLNPLGRSRSVLSDLSEDERGFSGNSQGSFLIPWQKKAGRCWGVGPGATNICFNINLAFESLLAPVSLGCLFLSVRRDHCGRYWVPSSS